MKNIFLLFAILISTTTIFAQTSETKRKLDITLIDSAELVKLNPANPAVTEKKRLRATQYVGFADKWNSNRPTGADKFKINYYLYVYLKDGSKRRFTIGGSKLQEQSWMTMDFGDKLYFDKLWKAIH